MTDFHSTYETALSNAMKLSRLPFLLAGVGCSGLFGLNTIYLFIPFPLSHLLEPRVVIP
jgi:hypothetical protein